MRRVVLGALALCVLLLTASCRDAAPQLNSGGDQHALVRAYTDGQGRKILLLQGRGSGHRGDWGWLHIKGKHVEGHWSDGGRVTTYAEAMGASSDERVQEVIGQALQQPASSDHGRWLYRYPVPDTRYEVLVVVGSDGTIITAYPRKIGRS